MALQTFRHAADKAGRGSISAVFDRGATPSDGNGRMPRPGSVRPFERHTSKYPPAKPGALVVSRSKRHDVTATRSLAPPKGGYSSNRSCSSRRSSRSCCWTYSETARLVHPARPSRRSSPVPRSVAPRSSGAGPHLPSDVDRSFPLIYPITCATEYFRNRHQHVDVIRQQMPFLHPTLPLLGQTPQHVPQVVPQAAIQGLGRYFGMKTT